MLQSSNEDRVDVSQSVEKTKSFNTEKAIAAETFKEE